MAVLPDFVLSMFMLSYLAMHVVFCGDANQYMLNIVCLVCGHWRSRYQHGSFGILFTGLTHIFTPILNQDISIIVCPNF